MQFVGEYRNMTAKKTLTAEQKKKHADYNREWLRRKKLDPDFAARLSEHNRLYYQKKKLTPEWISGQEKKRLDPEHIAKKRAYNNMIQNDPEKRIKRNRYASSWRNNNYQRAIEKERRNNENRDPIKTMLTAIRLRAKKKGLPFDLEPSDIVVPDKCPVLGIPIGAPGTKGRFAPDSASVDRIKPSEGYVKNNIKVISWRANELKSNCIDPEELRAVANYIEDNLAKPH